MRTLLYRNSLITPDLQGKIAKKTGNPRLRVRYSHTFSIIYGRIPYAMEQGILDNDQGMRTREQGMHLLVQGIAHWFGPRFVACPHQVVHGLS